MGYSVNGTGVMPLGYKRMPDGLYRVMLWITFFFIPIIPIGARLVRPTVSLDPSLIVLGDTFSFEIISRVNLNLRDVASAYLLGWGLTFLSLAPALIMIFVMKRHWPDGGAPWWCIASLLLSAVWPVSILGVLNQRQHRIHGEGVHSTVCHHESGNL